MTKNNYCVGCEIEFRVSHDANDEYYPTRFCPFCGGEVDLEEEYEIEDTESSAEELDE